MKEKEYQVIRLERDGTDHIIPHDFFDVLVHRLCPVLSLTYMASVFGIAAGKGDLYHYLFKNNLVYEMALLVVLWVAGPSIVWIFLNSSILLNHIADLWYRILAILMTFTIMLSYVLFPEAEIYGLRFYFVLSIPVFVIIYLFFIKSGLPKVTSYPLNALGLCTFIYGMLIGIVF